MLLLNTVNTIEDVCIIYFEMYGSSFENNIVAHSWFLKFVGIWEVLMLLICIFFFELKY